MYVFDALCVCVLCEMQVTSATLHMHLAAIIPALVAELADAEARVAKEAPLADANTDGSAIANSDPALEESAAYAEPREASPAVVTYETLQEVSYL